MVQRLVDFVLVLYIKSGDFQDSDKSKKYGVESTNWYIDEYIYIPTIQSDGSVWSINHSFHVNHVKIII